MFAILLEPLLQAAPGLRSAVLRDLGAGATALLAALVFGRWFIRFQLRHRRLERSDKGDSERLNALHGTKKHTPTMGGFIILAAFLAGALLWCDLSQSAVWVAIAAALFLGGVGFADDAIKLADPRRKGLSARFKLALQLACGAAVGLYLYWQPILPDAQAARSLQLPWIGGAAPLTLPLGVWFIALASLTITGSSNAVNLTDGLDGLAIGCSILSSLAFAAIGIRIGGAIDISPAVLHVPAGVQVSVMASSLAGAGLGFLWFNCHPAQVFMGDTGSLPLGGLLGLFAVLTKQELLLVVAGGVFVMEACSVILQVASFKLRGKRIFLIAPLHHHFQFKGWPESKITLRFWLAAVFLSISSIILLRAL